jgi:hypothetical protein
MALSSGTSVVGGISSNPVTESQTPRRARGRARGLAWTVHRHIALARHPEAGLREPHEFLDTGDPGGGLAHKVRPLAPDSAAANLGRVDAGRHQRTTGTMAPSPLRPGPSRAFRATGPNRQVPDFTTAGRP